MKIHEVEEQTGLTAKSIRYYESKGLIEVHRDEENGYRDYREEDVLHLKRIKLLRYLEFSIEDIRQLQQQELPEIQDILRKQAERFEEQSDTCAIKKDLCICLSKDYDMEIENGMVDEYNDAVAFLEGEFSEFRETIKDFTCPSLVQMILWTLVWGAPIIGLFVNIHWHNGDPGLLTINAVFAFFGAVFLTYNWHNYFQKRIYQKVRMREKNRRDIWLVPTMLVAIVFAIAALVLVNDLIIVLFAPDEWLFFEFQGSGDLLLILITELPFMGAILYLVERIRHVPETQSNDLAMIFGFFWKHKWISAAVWCLLFYYAIVNVTFVTPDKIYCHSTFHPTGVSYLYEEITQVKTGFGEKNFAFREYKKKGNFSYRISLGDKEVIFSQPSTNENIERYEDTYLELEEFDKKVMSFGAPKEGSEKHYDACDMDKRYVDRFLRIIRNQSVSGN